MTQLSRFRTIFNAILLSCGVRKRGGDSESSKRSCCFVFFLVFFFVGGACLCDVGFGSCLFSCHCPQSHDTQGGFHTCHKGRVTRLTLGTQRFLEDQIWTRGHRRVRAGQRWAW